MSKETAAMKSTFTKSANNLHAHALDLAINDDKVAEGLLKNYATIERQLRAMASMGEKQLAYAKTLDYKFDAIKTLGKAESREFYKRLRALLAAVTGQSYRDNPLALFLVDFSVNGPQEAYTYAALQSMFGHATTTQPGYFARCLSLIGVAEIDKSVKGNKQRGYLLKPNWDSKLLKDLVS